MDGAIYIGKVAPIGSTFKVWGCALEVSTGRLCYRSPGAFLHQDLTQGEMNDTMKGEGYVLLEVPGDHWRREASAVLPDSPGSSGEPPGSGISKPLGDITTGMSGVEWCRRHLTWLFSLLEESPWSRIRRNGHSRELPDPSGKIAGLM